MFFCQQKYETCVFKGRRGNKVSRATQEKTFRIEGPCVAGSAFSSPIQSNDGRNSRQSESTKMLKKLRDFSLAACWFSTFLNAFKTWAMPITEGDIHLVGFDHNIGNIKWASLLETCT